MQVVASSVNPADAYLRSGRFRLLLRPGFPFVPGADVAGVVEAVGPAVRKVRVGDAVAAMLPLAAGGGYAAAALVDEELLAAIPAGVSFAEAAALPRVGLTAWQALHGIAHVAAGDQVLVTGASGGVGSMAVQLALATGADVTGVGRGENVGLIQSLGVTRVLDRETVDPFRTVDGLDVVVDAAGRAGVRRLLRPLRRGGIALTTNPLRGNPLVAGLARITGRRLAAVTVRPSGTELAELFRMVTVGQLRPVIADVASLEQAADAHRRIEAGGTAGKLVLAVDPNRAHDVPVSTET